MIRYYNIVFSNIFSSFYKYYEYLGPFLDYFTAVLISNVGGCMMVFFTAHCSATLMRALRYFSGK